VLIFLQCFKRTNYDRYVVLSISFANMTNAKNAKMQMQKKKNDSNASFQQIMTELTVDKSKPVDKTMWSRTSKNDVGRNDGNEVRPWSKPVQKSKWSGLLAELIDCFKSQGTAGV